MAGRHTDRRSREADHRSYGGHSRDTTRARQHDCWANWTAAGSRMRLGTGLRCQTSRRWRICSPGSWLSPISSARMKTCSSTSRTRIRTISNAPGASRPRSSGAKGSGGSIGPRTLPPRMSGRCSTTSSRVHRSAASAAPLDRPLLILESETGSGKTEAAVLRFAGLWRAGLVDGLYFAVPTRAAAKQLHGRVRRGLDRLLPPAAHVQTVLAVPGYLVAGDAEGSRVEKFEVFWEDEPDEQTRLARWSAESARKFLSAPAAVGRVDQVLLVLNPDARGPGTRFMDGSKIMDQRLPHRGPGTATRRERLPPQALVYSPLRALWSYMCGGSCSTYRAVGVPSRQPPGWRGRREWSCWRASANETSETLPLPSSRRCSLCADEARLPSQQHWRASPDAAIMHCVMSGRRPCAGCLDRREST